MAEIDVIKEKWNEIINNLKEEYELTHVAYTTWIEPLKVYEIENGTLSLIIPQEHAEMKSYLSRKYALPLSVSIAEAVGKEYKIDFVIVNENQAKMKRAKNPKKLSSENDEKTNLNPNYTFDTFVVGSHNRFAQASALAVAESPGEIYNPLFLYGGVGLGKTHLMHSIAHFIQESNPELKVLYVTSEKFTNEVIEAIRNRNMNSSAMNKFRETYRDIDVLLIDDIQFIIGKESTQEEFFHTFNELHSANKQIVISSDRPPKEMVTLEDRIRSRFEWGLLADIGRPDYETRMAILRKKEELDGFTLDDEILEYIASNIKSNIRELEGALNKLLAYSNLENKPITLDIARHELQNFIYPDKPKEITPQLIIEVVSEHFQISIDQLIGKNRSSDIAKPRQIAMYLCKNMTSDSLDYIGQLLGGRDHSTIHHGINKIKNEYDSSESFRKVIDTIKKKISPN